MPLPTCDAGHDWSATYRERLRGASGVLIVRYMQQCLGCKKTREVFPSPIPEPEAPGLPAPPARGGALPSSRQAGQG